MVRDKITQNLWETTEMFQLAKCHFCKYEDLQLNPQDLYKIQSLEICVYNHSTREAETVDPWSSLVSQYSYKQQSLESVRPCLRKLDSKGGRY